MVSEWSLFEIDVNSDVLLYEYNVNGSDTYETNTTVYKKYKLVFTANKNDGKEPLYTWFDTFTIEGTIILN